MIGQHNLQNKLHTLIDNNRLPRFIILIGSHGSGRHTISKWLGKQLNAIYIESDIKVDDVRVVIEQSYKVSATTLYLLPDVQRMSTVAQNAMLKVTEEPPNNAYFIMTVEDESQILGTLLSRGTVYHMDVYTKDELADYIDNKSSDSDSIVVTRDMRDILLDVCDTPGEIDMLLVRDVEQFDEYVRKVVRNVAEVSGSNSFKIGQAIKLSDKDDESKYDLALFWKAFIVVCMQSIAQDPLRYAYGIRTTSKYLQELRITGINKQSTFDMWLLDIRAEWICRE